ncbi:MAG TPA: hypothetical protein VLT36_00235, partial [Candidatus Dormibacteraeota bacterium]|nr:hypothetical protein [Candidatus Dormibacteraeota bacterium]
RDATNNLLIVTNGARLISFGGFVGFGSNARSNIAIVSGAGSVWDSGNDFDFGGGSFNQLIVKLGGAIINSDAIIGNGGGTSNSVLINGGGSFWSNSASLAVDGSFNQLTVSAGAHLSSGSSLIDGTITSGSHNLVFIDQPGALWDAGVLYVGSSASFNQLVVSNSAKVLASELYLGFDPTSTNNRVVLGSGTLQVTNPVFTAPLDIRRGTNQLNNGLIQADWLLMTNTLGIFEFNGGTLNVRTSTVSNGKVFLVGNGSNVATLNLVTNGTHSFGNGLTIRSNGFLVGNGTITGTVTVESGGNLVPGTSVGKFILNNSPVLQGKVSMDINKNGATTTNDQVQVNGLLTYGGTLVVSDLGPDTLAAGNRFQLFSATGYGGSFSSIVLPSPGPGLDWHNRLGVDGSIQVVEAGLAIPLSRGSYFQDFNTLASNGVSQIWDNDVTLFGWYAAQGASPFVITTYNSSAGGDTIGSLYSFGSASSPERALGSLSSATPDTIGFGVSFTNDLGNALSNFVISYRGEQWRNGVSAVTNRLAFWYRTGSSPLTNPEPAVAANWTPVTNLDFVSPTVLANGTALDGNQPTNRHIFSSVNITGLSVLPGQNFFLRWVDTNDPSFDQGMAVDDLYVSFSGVARPQITSITSNPSNHFIQIIGVGTSNAIYVIQAASNLDSPILWQPIGSNAANAALLFQFTDTNAPAFPTRFYRALFP